MESALGPLVPSLLARPSRCTYYPFVCGFSALRPEKLHTSRNEVPLAFREQSKGVEQANRLFHPFCCKNTGLWRLRRDLAGHENLGR
jgi:hypothetical protein